MKNIWIVLVLVFSFVFVSQINAKDGGTMSKEEWNKFVESAVPLERAGQKSTTSTQLRTSPSTELRTSTEEKTSELDELINSRLGKDPEVLKKEGFSKDEWEGITKTTPLVKRYKDGSVAEKKFSARIGYGNAYKLGAKVDGKKYGGLGLNNSPVLTVKLGYSLSKYFEIQGDISRATNFENGEKYSDGPGYTSEWSNQLIISAYTANLKLTIPILLTDEVTFSPYIFGGLGRATYKSIYREEEYYDSTHRKGSETTRYSGNSLKAGVGFDLGVYKNIFLFSEYHYQEMKFIQEDRKITIYHSQTVGGVGLRF